MTSVSLQSPACDFLDIHQRVSNLVHQTHENIANRRRQLEEDLNENVLLENKIITERLSTVQGLQRHLTLKRMAQVMQRDENVLDPHSHATISKSDLIRKSR